MTTKEELHGKMVREVSKELNREEFGEIKDLSAAYLQKAVLQDVKSFTDLVNELKDAGKEVYWKCNGYSKLTYLFETINRPLIVNRIKDYEKRINFAKEESSADIDTVSAKPYPDARPPVIQGNVAIQTGKDSYGADDCSSTRSSVAFRTTPMKRKQQEDSSDCVTFGFSSRNSYYMNEVRQTIDKFNLHQLQRGTVTAAVLDSGIQLSHKAFASFKDDVEVINFLNQDVMLGNPSHGTACAAILAADRFESFDEGEKVMSSGAAPFIKLIVGQVMPKMLPNMMPNTEEDESEVMPDIGEEAVMPDADEELRVMSDNEEVPNFEEKYWKAFIDAMIKALNELNERNPPVDIISMSVGAPKESFTYEQLKALEQAIGKACERSIVVVAPSNEGKRDADTIQYPAQTGGIVVGSCDIHGNRSSFSAVGRKLDFLACGESLWVPSTVNVFTPHSKEQMETFSGTSGAAPLVAGIAAQVLAIAQKLGNEKRPGLGDELKKRLTNTSMMRETLLLMSAKPNSFDVNEGHGMLRPMKLFGDKGMLVNLEKIARIQ